MDDVKQLLEKYNIEKYLWGIGLPSDSYNRNVIEHEWMVDFVIAVESEKLVHIKKNPLEEWKSRG